MPYAVGGKADKVGSRQCPRCSPADRAGDHVAPSFALYFSHGISNLAPRAEAYTPKSCPMAQLQAQKELDGLVNRHYFDIYKRWFSSNLSKGIFSKFAVFSSKRKGVSL